MTPQSVRAVLAASILFAFSGAAFAVYAVLTKPPAPARATPPPPIATADALQAAFVSVADRVRPAVGHLGTLQGARGPRSFPAPRATIRFSRTSSTSSLAAVDPAGARNFRRRVWARASSSTSADTC